MKREGIIYGTQPATALPNNYDDPIKGLRFEDDPTRPKLSQLKELQRYLLTAPWKMYSGAGVYIPRGRGKSGFKTGRPLDAELEAIKHALKHILYRKNLQRPNIFIYTDSLVSMGLLSQTFKPDSYSIQLEVFKIREMIRKVLQSKY